jgi:flavin-dependent dehydrogenase
MRPLGPVVAMGPLAYRVRPPRHGGVALVGDAAGFYDPFTGEGVYRALASAELLAEIAGPALRRGDASAAALGAYARRRDAAFRDKGWITRAVQAVIARRRVASWTAHALAERPRLFDAILGVIGDYVPPRDLLRSPARSLWRRAP